MPHQPAISSSISFQSLFNHAGGRTSNVLRKIMRKKLLILGGLALAMSLLSPLLARIGSWKEVRRWNAPEPNPFGHERAIYLSVEQTHSFFDPLGLYGSERLIVTDGGYAYVVYFDVPAHPSKPWIDDCNVVWSGESVTFSSPSGLTLKIDKKAVLQKI
jgi:hypothetical protein